MPVWKLLAGTHRQANQKYRSAIVAIRAALNGNLSAVFLHNAFRNPQSQSGPNVDLRGEERFEQARPVRFADAVPV
jgi:hypothetical protein